MTCFANSSASLPLVSILVLNWNGEKVIRRSLESISRLEYQNVEVIVVDNDSTDASVDIVRKEFPEFRLLINERNLGFAAGMNRGIKAAKGQLVMLYNNDALAHSLSLSILVKRIGSSEAIGLAGGLILFHEPSNIVWSKGGMIDLITGTLWSEGLGKPFSNNCEEDRLVLDIDYLSGCVLLIKKEVIEKVGLLDEGFFMAGDDVDLCLRAKRAGYKCVLDPTARFWHFGSHSLRQLPLKSYIEREKSDFRTILLHTPSQLLLSSLFFQLVIMPIGEMLILKRSGVSGNARFRGRVLAFCENLKTLKKTLSRRREIQTLGALEPRVRVLAMFRFALSRAKSKEYFMGRLLQNT